MTDAVYGCDGCRTTIGRAGCAVHRDKPAIGANIYITHCLHGLDLRVHPRCYLCKPEAAHHAPERSGLDVADLGLSDEQTDILRDLLASRQQTVSQWLGDVLMDWHGLVEQTVRRLKDYRDGEALAAVRTVKPSEADRA